MFVKQQRKCNSMKTICNFKGGLGTTATPTFGSQTAPTGSLFGSSTFGQPSFQFSSPSSSFQLQKPPIGNKRGKQ